MATETLLLLVAAAFAAGYVDAIAGGGGLLTIPMLLSAGLGPAEAIATNKLQASFGVAASSFAFWKAGRIDVGALLPLIAATGIGAVLGALAVSRLDPALLKTVMPVVLLLVALYFLLSPSLTDESRHRRLGPLGFAAGIAAPVGFYDGVLGPGTGSLFLLAFVTLAGQGVLQATANTKLLNFTSNIVSLGVFLLTGKVLFAIGLPMAVGQVLGAQLGVRTAMRHGARIIKPIVVVVSAAIAVRLLVTSGNPLGEWLQTLFGK